MGHVLCGHAQDFRICGQTNLLVRTLRGHNPVCEHLPYMSNDEIQQQGKVGLWQPVKIPLRNGHMEPWTSSPIYPV